MGPSKADATFTVAFWHDREYKKSDVDAEAGFFLRRNVPAAHTIDVYELPAATVASTIHNGSYQRLPEAYNAMLRWVAASEYEVAGPIRELYLQRSPNARQDDESYVTEIQLPLSKINGKPGTP